MPINPYAYEFSIPVKLSLLSEAPLTGRRAKGKFFSIILSKGSGKNTRCSVVRITRILKQVDTAGILQITPPRGPDICLNSVEFSVGYLG
jgi:hypothetical protein